MQCLFSFIKVAILYHNDNGIRSMCIIYLSEAVALRCSVMKLEPATLLKKRLTQVFSCEFCKISKNIFSYRTPPMDASDFSLWLTLVRHLLLGFLPWPLNLQATKSTVSNVNLKTLTILTKRLILGAWLGPGRASADWYITGLKIQTKICKDK